MIFNMEKKFGSKCRGDVVAVLLRQIRKSSIEILAAVERNRSKTKLRSAKQENIPVFISPLESDVIEKRWSEFSSQSRKSIISLKKEVNFLVLNLSTPLMDAPEKLLRQFFSANHSCLLLLKGLENFSFKENEDSTQNMLMQETLLLAKQLLFLASKDLSKYTSNLNSTQNISVKPVGTENMDGLTSSINPMEIRKKLYAVAQSYKIKNIQQQEDKSTANKDNTEKLNPCFRDSSEGTKVQLLHDSLSPKLRQRVFSTSEGQIESEESSSPSSSSTSLSEPRVLSRKPKADVESLSEKMADAVFHKILPYVSSTEKRVDKASSVSTQRLDSFENAELLSNLNGLQQRIDDLDLAIRRHEGFARKDHSQYSRHLSSDADILDLSKVVQKAEETLHKWGRSLHPLLCPAYDVSRMPPAVSDGEERRFNRTPNVGEEMVSSETLEHSKEGKENEGCRQLNRVEMEQESAVVAGNDGHWSVDVPSYESTFERTNYDKEQTSSQKSSQDASDFE